CARNPSLLRGYFDVW
nr:immunoglobulin heavy chain junction region [Mus musculus]